MIFRISDFGFRIADWWHRFIWPKIGSRSVYTFWSKCGSQSNKIVVRGQKPRFLESVKRTFQPFETMPDYGLRIEFQVKTLIFLLIMMLLGSSSAYSNEYPFQVGEELTYEVKILGVKAGKQMMKIDFVTRLEGNEVYCITSKTASSSFFSLFYKVYDQIQTYLGVNDLLPRYLKADIHEGNKIRHTQTRIDQTNLTAVVLEADKPEKKLKIAPNTIDIVSLIYYLRSKDLELGDTFDLGILNTGSGVRFLNTQVEIAEKQTIEVPLGRFPALLAKQKKDSSIGIWFSNDKLRLPLKIEVPTPVGILSAMLKKVKGIKK